MSEFLQHIFNGLSQGTVYALVALGYTMVYGVLKLINFAHGDVMMVGVYVGYASSHVMGKDAAKSAGGIAVVFLVATLVCAAIGFLIERFAYRPLREKPKLTALITAIGVSFAINYGFQIEWQLNDTITLLPGSAPKPFPELFSSRTVQQIVSMIVAVSMMIALQVLVFRTKFGLAMRAVSYDHKTAALMGIPVDRVIALTFMLGSALAAVAGILYAMKDTLVQPMMGNVIGLKAFVAAVIGGIGHVPGAVAGAVLLGLVEEFVVGYGSSTWRDAVAFTFLIVVLLVKPDGMFGRRQLEKV
jgi:branched-chain amino acid transport system permease protein